MVAAAQGGLETAGLAYVAAAACGLPGCAQPSFAALTCLWVTLVQLVRTNDCVMGTQVITSVPALRVNSIVALHRIIHVRALSATRIVRARTPRGQDETLGSGSLRIHHFITTRQGPGRETGARAACASANCRCAVSLEVSTDEVSRPCEV